MSFFKWISNKISNFLKRLSEANQKEFGENKIDCCGLNKTSNTKTRHK